MSVYVTSAGLLNKWASQRVAISNIVTGKIFAFFG